MTKILALIDGSVYLQSVCDHAAWAAKRIGASVTLLHVLGRRETSSAPTDLSGNLSIDATALLLSDLAALDAERAKLALRRGRIILDQARARMIEDGVADVSVSLRHGDLLETVQDLESDADLVVIGKRGEAADFARLHLGSNLERIVRASHRPVLVASRAFKPIERFLIAFDGGPSATKAVDHIASGRLFRDLECRLFSAGAGPSETLARLDAAAKILLDAGYVVQAGHAPGEPEAAISAEVEAGRIDLLVMGAYGHSRIRNLIIGSTTTQMIRSCKVPILLFR